MLNIHNYVVVVGRRQSKYLLVNPDMCRICRNYSDQVTPSVKFTVTFKQNVGLPSNKKVAVFSQDKFLMANGRPGVGAIVKNDGTAGPLPLGETRLDMYKKLAIPSEKRVINTPKEGHTGSKLLDKAIDIVHSGSLDIVDGANQREIITENTDPRSITSYPPRNDECVQLWYEDPPIETTLGFPVVRPPHPLDRVREGMRLRKSSTEKYPYVQKFRHHYDVLIVGGGLVGSFIAYWLADKLPVSSGTTIGIVERDPSYKYSVSTNSPLGLRVQHSTPENVEMSLFGADFLRNIGRKLAVDGGAESDVDYFNIPNPKFQPHGHLTLVGEDQMADLKSAHELQRLSGAQTALLSRKQLQKRFPWLHIDGIAGGCIGLENEGWFDSWNLLQAVKLKNSQLGVDYIDGEVVYFRKHSLDGQSKHNVMDVTEDGKDVLQGRNYEAHVLLPDSNQVYPVHFGQLVIAGGGETGNIARLANIGTGRGGLGVEVPVERKRQFMFKVHSDKGPGLNCPLTIDPLGLIVRRDGHQGDYLVGKLPGSEEVPTNIWGDVDMSYWDNTILPMLQARVEGFDNPTVVGSNLVDYDYNYYDGSPIIGHHPLAENIILACGFGGLGAQMAPAVGRAVMELIHYQYYETIDLSRFHFDRVLGGREISEKIRQC